MGKLIHTDQKTSNKKIRVLKNLALGSILGLGTFYCITTALGLYFSPLNLQGGSITGGLTKSWNIIVDTIAVSDGIFLRKLAGEASDNSIFLLIFLLLLILVSWFIVASQNRWLLTIYIIPLLLPSIFLDVRPGLFAVALLALGLLLFFMGMEEGKKIKPWDIAFLVTIVVIIFIFLSTPYASSLINKPKVIRDIDSKSEEVFEKNYYGENPLRNGKLDGGKREDSKKTALEIKMSEPDSLYLRGFVGENFNGKEWKALPYGDHYSSKDLMYWLEKENFNGLGQLGYVTNEITDNNKEENNQIEVDVKTASKKYAYVPYEIKENQIANSQEMGGSFLSNKKFHSLKNYSYSASENATGNWTETTAKFFTSTDGENKKDYLINESHYNNLIYTNYTYVSKEDRQSIEREIGSRGNQEKGHIEYKDAINKIKNYLNENYIYTENVNNESNKKTGSLDTFINSKKGYDVHFSTIATLMFRYYGIPARYVEGYLITLDDVKDKKSDETITVARNKAHSWTEIYVDGIGFVPIEVSPGYEGVMKDADMKIGISNEELHNAFTENADRKNSSKTLEEHGENQKESKTIAAWIIISITMLILLVILIYFLMKLIRKTKKWRHRNRNFQKSDVKLAVCFIYEYMEEKKLDISENTKALGNKAAYSNYIILEKDRQFMLKKLKEMKKEKKENDRRKKKVK